MKKQLTSNIICILALATVLGLSACGGSTQTNNTMPTDSILAGKLIPNATGFEQTIEGKPVKLFLLKNSNGMQAAITNFGGRIVSLIVKDSKGVLTDVVAGCDDIKSYQASSKNYYGALIGRYGNRIAKGRFDIDGKDYKLFLNNGPNSLHGGKVGFDSKVWEAQQPNNHTLELTYHSEDMEEGYPGNLDVKVIYTLTETNGLEISYEAETDKATVLNLTNHSYFNLNGWGSGDILNHVMQINADGYTPVDATLIPTGKIAAVAGTPFDFKTPVTIGKRINNPNEQLQFGKGYDHNYVLNKHTSDAAVITVTGDKTGIVMKVFTDEPGVQFYSGNFMQGEGKMKRNTKDEHRNAFCLETQHFPDSPNQPAFPSTRLDEGKTYKSNTTYQFETK